MRPFTDVLAVNHFPFFFFFQIFIAYPNGRVIEHETNPEEKMLVTNLALENYKAAVHGVMTFEPLMKIHLAQSIFRPDVKPLYR